MFDHLFHRLPPSSTGFKLKLLVAGHNAFLSLGSLVMLVAIAAGVAGRLRETGGSVFEIVCDPTGAMLTGWPYFWLYVFYLRCRCCFQCVDAMDGCCFGLRELFMN